MIFQFINTLRETQIFKQKLYLLHDAVFYDKHYDMDGSEKCIVAK